MSEDLFAEKLAWFKQNERPEVVLLIVEDPELAKIVVAWTSLNVSRTRNPAALAGDSENEIWEWLWKNADYSKVELMDKSGTALSELGLEFRMKALIGNRILYPDGTMNSFVLRFLRDRVLKLFNTSPRRPANKT